MMTQNNFPAPLTVYMADWFTEKIEQQRALAATAPVDLMPPATSVGQARLDGINQTRHRVLNTLYEGHYEATLVDAHFAGGSDRQTGAHASRWFDQVVDPIRADLDHHRARSAVGTLDGAYSHGATAVLEEFAQTMQLGQDLAGGLYFHTAIPRRTIDPLAADGAVYAIAIQDCIDNITRMSHTNPEYAARQQQVLHELHRWHTNALEEGTTPTAAYLRPYDKPLPSSTRIEEEAAGWTFTFDTPHQHADTGIAAKTHRQIDEHTTTAAIHPHTPHQPETATFTQHPEPVSYNQHPDIDHHGHEQPTHHVEHHRGISR